MRPANPQVREKFILAAIREISAHGISDFSMRRVAESLNVSPGAPYKHFESRSALILAVIKYMNDQWYLKQAEIAKKPHKTLSECLVEISMEYIDFLCGNPVFQTVLLTDDKLFTAEQLKEKSKISRGTQALVEEYCRSAGMNEQDRFRKTYAVRSFIYGAAFFMGSGSMPQTDDAKNVVKACIEREFLLP